MAKKKSSNDEDNASIMTADQLANNIEKEFKNSIHEGSFIVDAPKKIISASPKADIALGGGIPEGSMVVLTGPEKCGKSVMALSICRNAQKAYNKMIYYANVEGRLKRRDLLGIKDLDWQDKEKFRLIASSQGNILSGEAYLAIMEKFVHGQIGGVGVIDSFSALCAESELSGKLTDVQVMNIQKTNAKFCRRVANALPINNVTLIGITHMMANMGFGTSGKTEKSGTALKYQTDVKLKCSHIKEILSGDTVVGQTAFWKVVTSAIGPPGQKFESHIKFGQGIWEEKEILELACDFGIINKSGAWFSYHDHKVQGEQKMMGVFYEEPEMYEEIKKEVYVMTGMDQVTI